MAAVSEMIRIAARSLEESLIVSLIDVAYGKMEVESEGQGRAARACHDFWPSLWLTSSTMDEDVHGIRTQERTTLNVRRFSS